MKYPTDGYFISAMKMPFWTGIFCDTQSIYNFHYTFFLLIELPIFPAHLTVDHDVESLVYVDSCTTSQRAHRFFEL